MSRKSIAAIVLGLVCLTGLTRATEVPTGTWKLTTTYGSRSRDSILKLNKAEDGLTGIMLHHLGNQSELRDVKFEDGTLSFRVIDRRSRQGSGTEYTGTVDRDTMSGRTTLRRRGETRDIHWTAVRTHDTPISPDQVEIPPVEADISLNEENYGVWRDHILPDQQELAWQEIPWLTTFKDGIIAADTGQKPLLLWTMNGHPLGCT